MEQFGQGSLAVAATSTAAGATAGTRRRGRTAATAAAPDFQRKTNQ